MTNIMSCNSIFINFDRASVFQRFRGGKQKKI